MEYERRATILLLRDSDGGRGRRVRTNRETIDERYAGHGIIHNSYSAARSPLTAHMTTNHQPPTHFDHRFTHRRGTDPAGGRWRARFGRRQHGRPDEGAAIQARLAANNDHRRAARL